MLTPRPKKGYRRIVLKTVVEVPEHMTDLEVIKAMNAQPNGKKTAVKRGNYKKLVGALSA